VREEETELGILDTVKDVITLVQKADNLELVKQVLALQNDIVKMMDENRILKDENRALEEQLQVKQTLSFHDKFYWMPKKEGTEDGPFCPTCQDVDHKLVRATEGPKRGYYFCQACDVKASYGR
jgi:regulator of replication initiation timing